MAEGSRRVAVTPARVLWIVLAIVAIILVAQNSGDTQIQVFGWTLQAPLFVVIVAAMLVGWGLGTLGVQAWSWRRRRGGDKRRDEKQPNDDKA
jgi:uncharacterized integral membrane protein